MKLRLFRVLCPAFFIFLVLCACVSPATGESPSPPPGSGPSDTESAPPPPTLGPTAEPTPAERPLPANLVPYSGPKYHIFYHFLIAFPEIAGQNSYGKNLDTDCVTPTEFRRSLEELYKNGYVLYDLNEYYEKGENGAVKEKTLMVPEGKKPLVMSFDDINYYSKNLGLGICDKVIIDPATDKLAMLTVQDGQEAVTYDNDVIPMLEAFCGEFPDFAPFGVKGMLNLTGYDGILGYRTNRDSPNRESEIEAVKPIVRRLLDNGWYFASHSYGHPHMTKMSPEAWEKDCDSWKNEVEPLVGETKIHVFAYGDYAKEGLWDGAFSDPRMRYLIDKMGFDVLCGVGMAPFFKPAGDSLFCDRSNIDGYSLRAGHSAYQGLMDPKIVYCAEERGGKPITWAP